MSETLLGYYEKRAPEYEAVYAKPERQADLAVLRERVRDLLAGHDVLEIACGTGWWTRAVAPVARSLHATDAVERLVETARGRWEAESAGERSPAGGPATAERPRVTFAVADAYDLAAVPGRFTAALAGFWWSHVLRRDLPRFLGGLHARLGAGALVVFLDNRYVEGSSTPVAERDAHGDEWQLRPLGADRATVAGAPAVSTHRVLKNFPSAAELTDVAARAGADPASLRVEEVPHYWLLSYRVGSSC